MDRRGSGKHNKNSKFLFKIQKDLLTNWTRDCEKKRDQLTQIWGLEQPEDENVIYRIREDQEGESQGWALNIWCEKPIRHPSGDVK